MAHTNTINSTRLETLTKDNYDTWVIQVEALLVKNDTWCYVSGEKPRPTSETEIAAWDIQDRKAKSDLILAINPTELKQVRGCKTSKEVWDKLKSVYDSKGPARKATLLKRLIQIKMSEGTNAKGHLADFFDAVDKLESMDVAINGDLLSIMLLYSLPNSYENFRCAIESRDALPTAEQLKIKIIEEYEARNQTIENESGALLAQRGKHNANVKPQRSASGSASRGETDRKTSTRFKYKCSFCKIAGHKYADCRKRKKQETEKANNTEVESFFAQIARHSPTNEHMNTNQWCLDSGCTSHLCKDIKMMTKPVQIRSDIKLASSATSTISAKGDVELLTSVNNQDKRIRLENALHVPDLRTNLLSVAKIVDKGYRVIFASNQAVIQDPRGNHKLIAKRQGDLYLLNGPIQQANMAASGKHSKAEIWHERFGHLNSNDLLRMSRTEAVSGLKLEGDLKVSNCKVCLTQKLTSLPFTTRTDRSQQRLGIVYTDLCGPMRTNSLGGARYFMTLIDDHSRWCQVYFLKSKDEALSKFVEYKNLVENQTGLKIKALHSDNGKEFCNSAMERALKESGIQRRLTIPHTPEQNGVAERKNRTLVEMARCLLAQSGLPVSFWAEAVNTANHIRNRCATKSLDERTPYELWNERKPDVSHLRSFGCKVIVLDKRPNKSKFEPRAVEGILVGYADTCRGYRIWVPADRKIIVARDVKFLEEFGRNDPKEDFTSETVTVEGDELSDNTTEADERQFAEIGGNQSEHGSNNPEDDSTNVPDGNSDLEEGQPITEPTARGPGRPRKILTGRPGRPTKQYQTKMPTQQQNADRATIATRDDTPEDNNSSDPEWFDAQFAMSASEIPFSQAVSGSNRDEWHDAIYSEIKSLVTNDTWTLVDRPDNEKVIGCRTVLRNKYKANGELERRKARIVAKGFAQRPGIDFHDTFAPVARLGSLRTLMAVAVERNMQISQIDITTAYLNGTMDTTVYMERPELLRQMLERMLVKEENIELTNRAETMLHQLKAGDKVCKLKKSLYGLRQAGRQWHSRLDGTLKELGLAPTNADPCVYHDEHNHILLLVYVDDIIIASDKPSIAKRLKEGLAKAFTIKDLGPIKYCLGIEVFLDREGIRLSQAGYVRDILERFGMSDCKPAQTPLDSGTKFYDTGNDEDINDPALPYRALLGSLMYLAQGTRPDIAFAVSALSQLNTCYNKTHWAYAKRVLRYLKGTINHGLHYTRSQKCLIGFTDADWGSCTLDRRSYTGTVFLLSNAAISWESRKQRTVALSSTEAEYVALSDAAKEAIYLSRFLSELGLTSLSRVILHNDNQGAGKLAVNPVFHSRSKHVDIRCHFIRQALSDHPLELIYTPTDDMIADVLTKPLRKGKHSSCIEGFGLKDIGIPRTRI